MLGELCFLLCAGGGTESSFIVLRRAKPKLFFFHSMSMKDVHLVVSDEEAGHSDSPAFRATEDVVGHPTIAP